MDGVRAGADQGLICGAHSRYIESVTTCWERLSRTGDPELLHAEGEGGGFEPEEFGDPALPGYAPAARLERALTHCTKPVDWDDMNV